MPGHSQKRVKEKAITEAPLWVQPGMSSHSAQEVDLQKLTKCSKNPSHKDFIPLKDFTINDLPQRYRNKELFQLVKAIACLTVRLRVSMSPPRAKSRQATEEACATFDINEVSGGVTGTGFVDRVNIKREGFCQCDKCKLSGSPSKFWGMIYLQTAAHVVCDDIDAGNTSCRLFFDGPDSALKTLEGWKVMNSDVKGDRCRLRCVTCDEELLKKLDTMRSAWLDAWGKVSKVYVGSRDLAKLTIIVSHPHGCQKHVSVGHWLKRRESSFEWTKYTYTVSTCPGCSGALVYILGCNEHGLWYGDRVHSGVDSEGRNHSASGRDWL